MKLTRHALTSLRYATAGFVLTLTAMGGMQLYAQSFKGPEHLKQIQDEAKSMVANAFASAGV